MIESSAPTRGARPLDNQMIERRQFVRVIPSVKIETQLDILKDDQSHQIVNFSEKGFCVRTATPPSEGDYTNAVLALPGKGRLELSVRVARRQIIAETPVLYELGFMVMERQDVKKYRAAVDSIGGRPLLDRRIVQRRNGTGWEGEERREAGRRGRSSLKNRLFEAAKALDRWGASHTYGRVLESACDGQVLTQGKSKLMLGANSYLGLTNHPHVVEKVLQASKRYGVGAGGVRALSGTMVPHRELEDRLANFKGTEACLLVPSGYIANWVVLSTLLQKSDVVFCDERNHASIVDGCRASGATVRFYRHKDMAGLEKKLRQYEENRGKLVVTDGVFSMDGDAAPLETFVDVAKKYGAMTYVDDAHGTGVMGKRGRGTAEYCGVFGKVDITVATLSKALGAIGGAICGSRSLIKHISHRARSFIFTSALPPTVCAAVMGALDVIDAEPHLLENLKRNRAFLVRGLRDMGYTVPETVSAIVPVIVGDEVKTYQLANCLDEMAVFVNAVSRPAVPRELSRLRVSLMATHTLNDLDRALEAFKKAGRKIGLI
jgi:8-amino-7-oxononanoate synthase